MRVIASCYFRPTTSDVQTIDVDRGADGQAERYWRMSRVLRYSAWKHCPTWVQRLERLSPAPRDSAIGNASHVWNHQKLVWWAQTVMNQPDGAELLLIDADTLVRRPLDEVWTMGRFDVAYTVRVSGAPPLNGGVVFVRCGSRTRRFFRRWLHADELFLGDAEAHRPWAEKYAGLNQASFGWLIEHDPDVDLLKLDCPEWNCCEWGLFDEDVTRVIHVKSHLRGVVFGAEEAVGRYAFNLRLMAEEWHAAEAAARTEQLCERWDGLLERLARGGESHG